MSMLQIRRSDERGHAQHGWLDSYHTFSFADYNHKGHNGFGSLRVINEDRVLPENGFGLHPHRNFEIFSYVVNGELSHNDSMENQEVVKRGEIQFTSAGSGIFHSEYNRNNEHTVHFIQIWVKPYTNNLEPCYHTRYFSDEEKLNKLCLNLSPIDKHIEGTIPINQDIYVYSSHLYNDQVVTHTFQEERIGYIHLIQNGNSSIQLNNDIILNPGDGVYIKNNGTLTIKSIGSDKAEFILFDLKPQAK